MSFGASVVSRLVVLILALASSTTSAQYPAPQSFPDLKLSINGSVYAIAVQSDGAIVFGGSFSQVDGVPRRNLARQRPDGRLDSAWNPSPNGYIYTLAIDSDGWIYAGGEFWGVGQASHRNLAKLSAGGSGNVDPTWQPDPSASVAHVVIDNDGRIYVAGTFANIAGESRRFLTRFSDNGIIDSEWNPAPDSGVHRMALDVSGWLTVAGLFESIGELPRRGLARISKSETGAVDPDWDPSPDGWVRALVLASSGDLYVGGSFQSIGGQPRRNLAKLSSHGTGLADPLWNPSPDQYVSALALDSDQRLYAGGNFQSIDNQPIERLARLSGTGVGTADIQWLPRPDGVVAAILAVSDDRVVISGEFTRLDSDTRLGLASIDYSGRAGETVDAEFGRNKIELIAVQPNGGLIVAGDFLKVNGLRRRGLVRLTPDGMVDPAWNPDPDGKVTAMALGGDGNVFVGGEFHAIGGESRRGIAKVSAAGAGSVDADWNPGVDDVVTTLAVSETNDVYVGGWFTEIGGQPRSRIAKLSGDTQGLVDPHWNPSADFDVSSLAMGKDGSIYVGGEFTMIGGVSRNGLAKLDGNGAGVVDMLWAPQPNSGVDLLTSDGRGWIYVAGNFSFVGGGTRYRLARLESGGTGAADPLWNPTLFGRVATMATDPQGRLYIGGDFATIGDDTGDVVVSSVARFLAQETDEVDRGWNLHAFPEVLTLATDHRGMVHVGGRFERIANQSRQGLVSIPMDSDWIFVTGDFENAH